MTSERDFDRLARTWLELGPDEAPDRVVAAVLKAAEATTQVRRPIRWVTWRSFHVTRLPIVATMAVAILAALVGGGVLLARRDQPAVGPPSATPSVAASPSAASSPAVRPSPSALPATAGIVLQRAPANLSCDSIAIDYDIATIRIDPAADPAVWAVTRDGTRLAVYWSAGFSAGVERGPLIRGPHGEGIAGDRTLIDIRHWPSHAPWNAYFLCPGPDTLYVLEHSPG